MARRLLFKTLLAIAIIATKPSLAGDLEKIHMIVGESRDIRFERALKVHISRKGIVHLIHQHDDRWQLTALRSGMVAIEIKSAQQLSRTIYVLVKQPETGKKLGFQSIKPTLSSCASPTTLDVQQFQVLTTVEMANSTKAKSTGHGVMSAIKLTPSQQNALVSFDADLTDSSQDRKIIGDPIITANPCTDIEIHAGGEEQTESRTGTDAIVSVWKQHGLSLRMKLIPMNRLTVRVPYSISLRTPAKRNGSYGLSEAKSSIDLNFGERKLAAVINLSSSAEETRRPFAIADIPIIGPILTGKTESESYSKLIIWLEVRP